MTAVCVSVVITATHTATLDPPVGWPRDEKDSLACLLSSYSW